MKRGMCVWLALLSCSALAAPIIVIDPGHGGTQDGASSPSGQLEKNVTLMIAKKLKSALEAQLGAAVRLTRETDLLVHLNQRVEMANKLKPDVFISVHLNSMPTAKQQQLNEGVETYFLSASASGEQAKKVAARENAEVGGQTKAASSDTLSFILADLQKSEAHFDSSRLAYSVHEAVVTETGAFDRGVQQAPFFVLMGLSAPAILIEVGFISHPEESKRLLDVAFQQKLADGIARGVQKFLAQTEARDVHRVEAKKSAAADGGR